MPGNSVNSALLLLVVGNALAVVSDVFVKVIGNEAPVFQFILARSLITLFLLLPFLQQLDRRRLFRGLGIHTLRSHLHLAGVFCMVIALTSLPLATANAIFYVAPIIVMLISVIAFRERLTALSLIAVISGFSGILVILRPVSIEWAALSALGAAAALAASAVLVRLLPPGQSTIHQLFLNYLLLVPAAALLAWWENAPFDPAILTGALGSAVFILGYNATVLLAYRSADANRVTSAEYTGLLWAVLIGWLWFEEAPDFWFAVGSAMVVVPLVLMGFQQSRRTGYPR